MLGGAPGAWLIWGLLGTGRWVGRVRGCAGLAPSPNGIFFVCIFVGRGRPPPFSQRRPVVAARSPNGLEPNLDFCFSPPKKRPVAACVCAGRAACSRSPRSRSRGLAPAAEIPQIPQDFWRRRSCRGCPKHGVLTPIPSGNLSGKWPCWGKPLPEFGVHF